MKNIFKGKFKNNSLVKPLYRKLNNKINPRIFISANDTFKLDAYGVDVKKDVETKNDEVPTLRNYRRKTIVSCDTCENYNYINNFEKVLAKDNHNNVRYGLKEKAMLKRDERKKEHTKLTTEDLSTKLVQTDSKRFCLDKVKSSWLRLYPMPKLPQESTCSVILRCFLCQLGITTFLVFWTMIFIFLIHYFEGPYEIKITTEFVKQHNRLVIDLATELRQLIYVPLLGSSFLHNRRKINFTITCWSDRLSSSLSRSQRIRPTAGLEPPQWEGSCSTILRWLEGLITPLSPRWKAAIEHRLEQVRQMTSAAMINGARLRSGHYWDLPGTFLFTVYVMTALGFGAPVPQSVEGRISAMIYAILAVPLHFYLVFNTATAIVVQVEIYMKRLWTSLRNKILIANKHPLDNESSNYNAALLKSSNRRLIEKFVVCLINTLGVFRCVPIAICYYATGACIFGIFRDRGIVGITMFPLEFTTNGGLDRVPGHIRIIYGFYLEGAVILIACALATIRRYNSPTIKDIYKKYRLFSNCDTII